MESLTLVKGNFGVVSRNVKSFKTSVSNSTVETAANISQDQKAKRQSLAESKSIPFEK